MKRWLALSRCPFPCAGSSVGRIVRDDILHPSRAGSGHGVRRRHTSALSGRETGWRPYPGLSCTQLEQGLCPVHANLCRHLQIDPEAPSGAGGGRESLCTRCTPHLLGLQLGQRAHPQVPHQEGQRRQGDQQVQPGDHGCGLAISPDRLPKNASLTNKRFSQCTNMRSR